VDAWGANVPRSAACLEAGKEANPTDDVKLVLGREPSRFEVFLDREGDAFHASRSG